jgi:acetyltransferase
MFVRNLDKLFKPRAVTLIGATPQHGSLGAVLARNPRRGTFGGPLFAGQPAPPVDWRHAGPSRHREPAEVPDLAVIATPPETVPGAIADLGARGTRAGVVITACCGEQGASGRALQQAALDAARPHLLRLVGPNCVGIMIPAVRLDASFSHIPPLAGDLAFVSQSGGMITAVLAWGGIAGDRLLAPRLARRHGRCRFR